MRRIIFILLFLNFILSIYSQKHKIEILENIIEEALQNNPQLLAARKGVSAVRTEIAQATAWESPQIGVEFRQTPVQSFPNPLKNGMETDYYFQQMIPFPGKLSAMGNALQNKVSMTEMEYETLKRKIIRQVKSAYYELYYIQRKIQINAENQEFMKKFVDLATQHYEVGMGNQQDILRAQTEFSLLINEGMTLQKEERTTKAMLNALLNRPIESEFGFIPDIEVSIPPLTLDELLQLAEAHRPELKAMKFAIEMNKAETRAAKREYFPDIMTRVMYMDMAMTKNDFWSVMVGFNFPLFPWSSGKYTSRVEEKELRVNQSEYELQSMKNMIVFEVQEAFVKLETYKNLMLLYKTTVIPQAEQTLNSTIAAYQTGKTEFLMVIDAYRMTLMAKLDYHMAVMNTMNSLASLEQAVGLELENILDAKSNE